MLYNTAVLPKPVARMHDQLMEAALSGDMERLRMVLESNEMPPTLSFGETGDPIEFLKSSSGDGEGFEIMAILADVLDAGFVHVDAGTPQEMYVWPYFARYPLDNLRPDQKVELFRIITAGDFAAMQEFGAWNFYRVGVGPDGTLHYFVAGGLRSRSNIIPQTFSSRTVQLPRVRTHKIECAGVKNGKERGGKSPQVDACASAKGFDAAAHSRFGVLRIALGRPVH
ncbi:hypothetical protein QW131_02205 [Roseibium salinum]|nr:hypothetical protein [Roseibium salinum]